MHVHRTAALLWLVALLVAGIGVAAAADAPAAVRAENTTVDYSGEAATLVTEQDATVTGETSLDAGTNLMLIMRSSGEHPFLTMDRTTVSEDGRFVATFDLADMPDGANATLMVRSGGEQRAEIPVRLVAERTPTPTDSPTPDPTGVPTSSPTPSNTSSGDGPGFGSLVALFAVLGTALAVSRRA
jgi:PGF-CTERM protein